MTIWLLDTNVFVALLRRGSRSPVSTLFHQHVGTLAASALTAQELYRGVYRGGREETSLPLVEGLLGKAPPIPFDTEDARIAGRLDADLSRRGVRIGPFDICIAAQALARDLVLVTHNTREFARVDGLRIEDWEVG